VGKIASQTEALMVNVNRSCKLRGCGTKDWCLTSGDPTHISEEMVEKGLERESDEVIAGNISRAEVKKQTVNTFIKRLSDRGLIIADETGGAV